MTIPTEPIGSIPRPVPLIEAMGKFAEGRISQPEMSKLYESALRDTITRLEATGSPVISDGEQTKPSFATYPIHGLDNLASDGIAIPFADGHQRRLPRLTSGPFRYKTFAVHYLRQAHKYAHVPVKQAVISASALSLLYPEGGIDGYSREEFVRDLVGQAASDIRQCLAGGAYNVQVDFTEGRLALKLDPSKRLLQTFVQLNNEVLSRFTAEERARIGVHTCPGGDKDSTHSADIDYAELLPALFALNVGRFYLQLASEKDRVKVLTIIKQLAKPHQKVFVGVTDPLNPRVETAEEVRDRVLEAADYIPVTQLGTTDDCGFAPFADDTSTARDTAFEKIRARVAGTRLASERLGV
jgi:5-methyltetrahydropteroyltriglutamate--homocysteine methyltransferase